MQGAIPHDIGLLTGLTFLEIAGWNPLLSVPPTIGQLSNLVSLYLRVPPAHPDTLGRLIGLRDLALSCTGLDAFPAFVHTLTNLTSLSDFGDGNNNNGPLSRQARALLLRRLPNLRELSFGGHKVVIPGKQPIVYV